MLKIPSRNSNALSGSDFIRSISNMKNNYERDGCVYKEVLSGNIPNFLRRLVPITIKENGNTLVYNVMPDYLSIGNNEDYIRVPVGASTAQRIADDLGCTLPTPKMSDQIWSFASVKLAPKPMGASDKMTHTNVFVQHNNVIQNQYKSNPGQLVAGHKKDIVISNQLIGKKNRLGIHGLHASDGKPIQGGALSPHSMDYTDYSHGIRLIDRKCTLNGQVVDLIDDVAKNKKYAYLVSNEGALAFTSYNVAPKKPAPSPREESPKENSSMVAKQTAPKKNSRGRIIVLERIFDYVNGLNNRIS
jgi:hypothetical protein